MTPDSTAFLKPHSINNLNLYCYCQNDPINNIDPTGRWSWRKFWKGVVIAAVVVAVVAATVAIVASGGVAVIATKVAIGARYWISCCSCWKYCCN